LDHHQDLERPVIVLVEIETSQVIRETVELDKREDILRIDLRRVMQHLVLLLGTIPRLRHVRPYTLDLVAR
jgi:hypothetical protein